MVTMKRTFHPVGHGAFYTERFYDGDDNIANIVFDCGCYECGKEGKYKDRIENAIKLEFAKDTQIDILFISHFHQDHILGVRFLNKYCSVDKIFIPILTPVIIIEAYLYNYNTVHKIDCYANNLLRAYYTEVPRNVISVSEFRDNVELPNATKLLDDINIEQPITTPLKLRIGRVANWLYIPYNRKNPKEQDVIEKITREKGFENIIRDSKVDIKELTNAIKKAGIGKCRKVYKSIFGEDQNTSSMTLYSGRCCREHYCLQACLHNIENNRNKLCTINCLYMGDYEAMKNFTQLQRFYGDYWSHIGILQVPHHGSDKNYNDGLYDPEKICIISAGETDRYEHPNLPTLNGILKHNSIPIIVTENVKTKQQFTYNI